MLTTTDTQDTNDKNDTYDTGHSLEEGEGHDREHMHRNPGGIYLFSPSSAVKDAAELELARGRLAGLGFKTTVDRSALAVEQRFAGSDCQRLAAIQRAISQRHPIVMATRGGYGLSRLLHQI